VTRDEAKYFYVLATLDQDTATRLLDLISRPPPDDKYQTLKDRLINTFGLDRLERASRLLHFRRLGDSKPSALMDDILALLGDHTPCLLFEQLFLERLPEDIRIQLAKRADALWTSRDMQTFPANAVQRRYPTAGHKQSKPNKVSADSDRFCYYNRAFGETALKCRRPCAWSGSHSISPLV
jgi:hypothetical protein